MIPGIYLKIGVLVAFVAIGIGAYAKISHFGYADIFLAVGLLASISLTIIAFYEISKANSISRSEKITLMAGLILMNLVFSIVYYFIIRKRAIHSL